MGGADGVIGITKIEYSLSVSLIALAFTQRYRTQMRKKEQTAAARKARRKALATFPDEGARQCFLEGVNADFADLRNDPTAWQEELAERATWDCTLADGLNEK
jgi:hypothetical protein